ncbi:MAG: hypothetical protein GY866_27000 [Proteobacteria bacterium]|nr:hypothetical protein [Pseudomonadota bacterium]
MNDFLQFLSDSIDKVLERHDNPRDQLIALVEQSVESFLAQGEILDVTLDFWAIGLRSSSIDLIREAYEYYTDRIAAILEDGASKKIFRPVDSRSLASSMIGMLDGLLFQLIVFKETFGIQSVVAAFIDHLLAGLAAGDS